MTRALSSFLALAGVAVLTIGGLAGCGTSDPVQPLCAQIDLVPQTDVLPADGYTSTRVDIAVCTCNEGESDALCDEASLMKGRMVNIDVNRGSLSPSGSTVLSTGRGVLELTASSEQETATIVAWTNDGFTGTTTVHFVGPLSVEQDDVSVPGGGEAIVAVKGYQSPLTVTTSDPDVLDADADESVDQIMIRALTNVSSEQYEAVTVVDALEQVTTLSVTITPTEESPSAFVITPAETTLDADGLDETTITVTCDECDLDGTLVYLSSSLGSLYPDTLALQAGTAECLYVAGTDAGTDLIVGTIGTAYEAVTIELQSTEETTTDFEVTPDSVYMAPGGAPITFDVVGATGTVIWSTLTPQYVGCADATTFAPCEGTQVDLQLIGDPWEDGESTLYVWATDDAGNQDYVTISYPSR